jgi:L,D-peptidoglycan transpeptidase YkuD (ErfK/YbiS/YcfS/YnhG family)
MPNLDLTPGKPHRNDGLMRRFRFSLTAALSAAAIAVASAPVSHAFTPWFAPEVGTAAQVLSVTGTGGSNAKIDVWQRGPGGWQPVDGGVGIPAFVGSAGLAPKAKDAVPATPMGVYTLDFAFGTEPNPGGGLQYVQTTPDHWWSADGPTYNTMQVCKQADCPFNTSLARGTENLYIPAYAHAIVMGVNKERVPGNGGAFFVHTSNGAPTAGCVSLDDTTLANIIKWLKPGAVIAIAEQ